MDIEPALDAITKYWVIIVAVTALAWAIVKITFGNFVVKKIKEEFVTLKAENVAPLQKDVNELKEETGAVVEHLGTLNGQVAKNTDFRTYIESKFEYERGRREAYEELIRSGYPPAPSKTGENT